MSRRPSLSHIGTPLRNRTALVVAAVTLIAIPAVLVGLIGTSHAQSVVTPQIPGSVAAPTTADVSPVCDAPNTSSTLGPASSVPSSPTSTVVTPSGGVDNFTATSSGLYVNTGTALATYNLDGTPVSSFPLPSGFTGGNEISQPVVDSSGNIYLATYYGQKVDKFSPSGTVLWSTDPESGNPTGLFSMGSGASFQLVVSVVQSSSRSDLLNPATGAISGSFPLVDHDAFVTQEANGNLLYSGNGYVTTYNSSGSKLSTFGAAQTEGNGAHTGSGYQFYYASQAVQGPDGTIYTADPLHTIESTSPNGYLQNTTTLGGALNMGGFNFYLVGSTLYYQGGAPFNGGADNISSVSLATLTTYLDAVHVPTDTLGWGAGLSSTAAANYFAPGSTPTVVATFDPWWASQASHLQLSYSVENTTSLNAETVPTPTTLPLPTTTNGLASIPLTVPTADQQPGPYLVQATLTDTSTSPPTSLGTTCMPYTVGAGGDALNLASLPTGIGGGGPTDTRGVALNSQLGLSGLRGAQIDWSSLLPNCSPSAPTPTTCGPSGMNLASLPTSYFKAAATALADHVTYWVQASSGSFGSVPSAVVQGGWWQADVTLLVQHYATVPAGCGVCAPITMWEPWNEPNNTGWSNGATYVSQILQPFYAAVKSVLPGSSSTVIGGASLDVPIPWWQQLIGAGGLRDLDVASVHPYTGNNDSFEEYGNIPALQQLEGMLGSIPLWFTEVGWWNDGDYNYLNQANVVARAMIWQKVLHVPVWNYFFSEGNWGNDGVSFSLIQAGSTDDYVKPAALATMATSNQVGDRPYVSMPSTGIPQTYEATFGPGGSNNNQLAAVWSDGLATTGAVTVTAPGGGTVPVTVTSEYGSTTDVSVTSGAVYSLPIADQISYLSYPVGDTLTIAPPQSYGTDLAAATSTNHSSATASSGNASAAIAGTTSGSGWSSANGDSTPSFTVNLANPATINRVVIDTQSVGSTASSVRNYVVSVDEPSSGWTTVATVAGQYRTHELQLAFDPVMASAVRITVSEVNFGGYYGGGIPPWWTHGYGIATAFLHAIQVYAGTGTADQVNGTSLTPLIAGGPGTPPTTTTTTTTTTVPPTSTTTTTAPTTTTTTGPPDTSTTTTEPPTTTTTTEPPTTTTTTTVPPTTTTTTVPPTTTTTTTTVPPTTTTTTTTPPPTTTTTTTPTGNSRHQGFRIATRSGAVYGIGSDRFPRSSGHRAHSRPVVAVVDTPDGRGYWLASANGDVSASGDAHFFGSAMGDDLSGTVVGMAATTDGGGYWLVTSTGQVRAFGDAYISGPPAPHAFSNPIVGITATPDGKGYSLVASDGGVFTFGDATFHGSEGGLRLDSPIVGMATTPDGGGYWLVSSTGKVFAFGDANLHRPSRSTSVSGHVVGMAATPDGRGYWVVSSNGRTAAFGDARLMRLRSLNMTGSVAAVS